MKKEMLLKLKNIHIHYGGVKALDGVSVCIDEGEIVALIGPNGAGKSTVLKTIFGLAPIAEGSMYLHERKYIPVPHRIVQEGITYVPQGRRVFSHLTVAENLEIGAYIMKDKEVVQTRMQEVMELFPDLKQRLKVKAGMLSGGQQQMLAIARGLMVDPKILLLDEPSLGLAPKVIKEVFAKIQEINQRHTMAVMIVEHNLQELFRVAQRVYVLDKGRVITEKTPYELRESSILKQVFLGAHE